MKVSLCGQDDCPTPYEFCEACVRADEREQVYAEFQYDYADEVVMKILRAKVEALPSAGLEIPYGETTEFVMVRRADMLALFDLAGSTDPAAQSDRRSDKGGSDE